MILPVAQVRKGLRKVGLELSRYGGSPNSRRQRVLENCGVNLVLDVGANSGQYGSALRAHGYDKRMVSFEPLPSALKDLAGACAGDPLWEPVGFGIGDRDESRVLHVAGNSQSSSFRAMLEKHLTAAPESAYVGDVMADLRRLDSVADDFIDDRNTILLKVDVQGYEEEVLEGASETLKRVSVIEMEMSLVPLYEGQILMSPMIDRMQQRGFELIGLERGYEDPQSGHLLQVDGMFLEA